MMSTRKRCGIAGVSAGAVGLLFLVAIPHVAAQAGDFAARL